MLVVDDKNAPPLIMKPAKASTLLSDQATASMRQVLVWASSLE